MPVDEETLNRFRDETIAAFAHLALEVQAIQKVIGEKDVFGPTRLAAIRGEAFQDSLQNWIEHYSVLIAPVRKPQ